MFFVFLSSDCFFLSSGNVLLDSFIQQKFVEYLGCAGHCARHWSFLIDMYECQVLIHLFNKYLLTIYHALSTSLGLGIHQREPRSPLHTPTYTFLLFGSLYFKECEYVWGDIYVANIFCQFVLSFLFILFIFVFLKYWNFSFLCHWTCQSYILWLLTFMSYLSLQDCKI